MASLPSSWQEWYNEPMNSSMSISDLLPANNVECVMWGTTDPASHNTSDVAFSVAAFGRQHDVARISETDFVYENGVRWFHETDVNPEVVGFTETNFEYYMDFFWAQYVSLYYLGSSVDTQYRGHTYGTYGGYEDSGITIPYYNMKWRLGSSEGIRGMGPEARKVVMFGPCEIECEDDYHFGKDCITCDGEGMYFDGNDCAPCPGGYGKEAGAANVCLPTLQTAFLERSGFSISVTMLGNNVLGLRVLVFALPDEMYGSNVSLGYRFDVAPTEADLHFDSPCSRLWTVHAQHYSHSYFETTLSNASGPCSFNETIDGAYAEWSTLVAVFVVADSGEVSPPHLRPFTLLIDREVGQIFEGGGGWGFRIITADAQAITVDGPSSTLQIFNSPAYATPMLRAFFTEGDDIFVEHKIDSSAFGFTVGLKLAWLSTSLEVDNQVGLVRNLTAEVGRVVGVGGIRYSFKASGEGCDNGCWLHSLLEVTGGSARRLQATTRSLASSEADGGESYSGASVDLTIKPLTTPPPEHEEEEEEDAAEPDLHEFRHPAVVIVAAVGAANAVTWPTVVCILHCRGAAAPADMPLDQQRYRILRDHALKVLMTDLLRLLLGVASFALAWHLKELEATSDPDVMLRGLMVFASLGGFLFLVEATGWTFWRCSERCSSLQQPKSMVLLACLYLLLADVPTVVVYAGVALFGWLDGSFPWVSTLGVVFAILLLVGKLVALRLATKAS